MPITQGVCNSYKAEIPQGIHTPTDTYMMALYTSAADLSPNSQVYSAVNEAGGAGYVAGGKALTGFNVVLDGNVAIVDFDDVVWDPATLTARAAMIYNQTRAGKAVAIIDFLQDYTSTNGPWSAAMPPPTAATGLIRIGP